MNQLERAIKRHQELADKAAKQADARDKAIAALVRAQQRYYDAVKAVTRSGKRLDKLRAEERKAKRTRKPETPSAFVNPITV